MWVFYPSALPLLRLEKEEKKRSSAMGGLFGRSSEEEGTAQHLESLREDRERAIANQKKGRRRKHQKKIPKGNKKRRLREKTANRQKKKTIKEDRKKAAGQRLRSETEKIQGDNTEQRRKNMGVRARFAATPKARL